MDVIVETVAWEDNGGAFFFDVQVDRAPWWRFGPFNTVAEREAVLAEVINSLRRLGGQDMPLRLQ